MRNFGDRLKIKIKESGMKQYELAELMGLHYSTISGWVIGKNMPTEENLNTLCDLLGCDADWLQGNTRQLNRNASGVVDPTMYEAMKNIESEGKTMDITRGSMWEVEMDFGNKDNRKALIVSSNENTGDKMINVIFLNDADFGKIVVSIERGNAMYADCTKVSLIASDRLLDCIGEATEQEMADIDAGIIEALGLPGEVTVTNADEETKRLRYKCRELENYIADMKARVQPATPTEDLVRLQVERDLYKEQYEKLFNKMIGKGEASWRRTIT